MDRKLRMDIKSFRFLAGLILLVDFGNSMAMDDAQTLPAGVSRAMLTSVHTSFDSKRDSGGSTVGLANRLEKSVTFSDFAKARSGFARSQVEAFLLQSNIDPSTSVGTIKADTAARVDVFAPSLAYGVTSKLSVGFVVPYYTASSSTKMQFVGNDNSNAFLTALGDVNTGVPQQVGNAVEALNTVTSMFNTRLTNAGYEKIGDWEGRGLGDVQTRARYQSVNVDAWRLAQTFTITAPTGATDNPDSLVDIPFGDGQWDVAISNSVDRRINSTFTANQYVSLTAQLPGNKDLRMRTDEEAIDVEKKNVGFDLGDKIDAGASISAALPNSFSAAAGYAYAFKFQDQYSAAKSSDYYEQDTQQSAHYAEGSIAYSTVEGYKAGTSTLPAAAAVTYAHQLAGVNVIVQNKLQLEAKVFF